MGGRKRRQETTTTSLSSFRSTSMRRDSISTTKTTPKYTQQVKIGCMSGIFQFVSKYHTRHKFLTFGKKQERDITSRKSRSSTNTCQSHNHRTLSAQVTLEVPRSPAIPAEIRRITTSISPPSSPPKAAAITCLKDGTTTTEVAAEKRRKLLLGALEKCDEDLQALKRIIKAVRDVQSPSVTPPRRGGCSGGDDKEFEEAETGTETESEEPSPVSVLDHHRVVSRSPNISCTQRTREVIKNEFKCQDQQPTRQQISTKKAGEEDNTRILHFQKEPYTSPFVLGGAAKAAVEKTTLPPTSRWSSETRETVIEVCKDVECGMRLEAGNFGFVLQHFIFRDLLDEFMNELETPPNDAFRRKLSF